MGYNNVRLRSWSIYFSLSQLLEYTIQSAAFYWCRDNIRRAMRKYLSIMNRQL